MARQETGQIRFAHGAWHPSIRLAVRQSKIGIIRKDVETSRLSRLFVRRAT